MEYEYRRISDLGRVVTGKTPPTENEDYYDGEFPFITPSDIHSFDEKYLAETERTISSDGAQTLQGMLLPPQSVCFVCIGSTIGKMCMTSKKSYSNQQINTLIPNKQNDNDYLFYLLRYIKSYFQSIGGGTGSGKGIVNKTLFSKTKLYILKEKADQKRIAKYLSAYDSLIEINNKRIKVLEQMAENLYKEWFVRFRFPGHETTEFENGLPKGWRTEKLKAIAGFQYGKMPLQEHVVDNGYPIYTGYRTSGYYDSFLYEKPMLLVIARGVGGTGDVKMSPPKAFITNLSIVFLLKNPELLMYYLYQMFQLHNLRYLDSGAAQSQIAIEDLQRVRIVLPDNSILMKYNNAYLSICNEIHLLEEKNTNLIKQRDLLLPRLMSGNLEVK